jgi:hypothetical protein
VLPSGGIAVKNPRSVDNLYSGERGRIFGKSTGTPLRTFLERVGAGTTSRRPQTLLTFNPADAIPPREHGFPFELQIPARRGLSDWLWL